MIATNCDRLELSVNGTPGLSVTPDTETFGALRPGIVGDVTLTLTGPGTLIAANPLPLATLGGVAGGFIRSQPGKAGPVTVSALHATLGRSSVRVAVSGT